MRFFEEVQQNIDDKDAIKHLLNDPQPLLRCRLTVVNAFFLIVVLIRLPKNHNIRRHEQIVDYNDGDQEVPDLARGALPVDHVPFEVALLVVVLVHLLVVALDYVVDHHFFQVRLRHLLQAGLEAELVGVTPHLIPIIFNPFPLLQLTQLLPRLLVRTARLALPALREHVTEAALRLFLPFGGWLFFAAQVLFGIHVWKI